MDNEVLIKSENPKSTETAIKVENISKTFRIFTSPARLDPAERAGGPHEEIFAQNKK